ncbi:N-methyl-L-tryptophan oxidase [Georgenia sp. SUBG003]|uniref:N-methyl-L-tryptophan oxidase n=1 Tax=Georgenia sp. SUBG003 TaxID=1497974 RepID=UPI0004D5D682|nr:sarcosine oxidase [Georgenia sp. SUBG003]
MSTDADVAVIGLGSIGSMALWRLARRGVRVHGYERFGIGHTRGASGGQTRRFAALSQSDPRNTPLALSALQLWRELEDETGQDLLTLTGGVIIGPEGTTALTSAASSAAEHGLAHEVLDAPALRRRFPQHLVRPTDVGVVDQLTGFVRPERSIVCAVGAATGSGAVVHDYTRVLAVEPDDDGVTVRTNQGTRRYLSAVVAPGAWAGQLIPDVGTTVVPRRLTQAWYLPRDLSLYVPAAFPVFERVGDVRAYGFPSVDGATIKIGVYTDVHPEVPDVEDVDLHVTEGWVREVREVIATYFPGVHADPVAFSTHIEGYSPDGRPIVGPVPGAERLVAGCGFSGAGFKFAPMMGEILAEYASGGGEAGELAHLRPDRFGHPAAAL